MIPSVAKLRSCCPSIFWVIFGIARSRSEKRITLPPNRWNKITSFDLPSKRRRAASTSAACSLLVFRVPRLLEDDGFVFVEENSVFNVPTNGAGEDHFFKVAPFFNKVFKGIAMRNASDALFDDRAVVEDFGDIVRSGADEFYAALIGLVMGFCADEGW